MEKRSRAPDRGPPEGISDGSRGCPVRAGHLSGHALQIELDAIGAAAVLLHFEHDLGRRRGAVVGPCLEPLAQAIWNRDPAVAKLDDLSDGMTIEECSQMCGALEGAASILRLVNDLTDSTSLGLRGNAIMGVSNG